MSSSGKWWETVTLAESSQGGSGTNGWKSPYEYKKETVHLSSYNTDSKMETLLYVRSRPENTKLTISDIVRKNSGYPKTESTIRALIREQIQSGGIVAQGDSDKSRKKCFLLSKKLEDELNTFFEMFHFGD